MAALRDLCLLQQLRSSLPQLLALRDVLAPKLRIARDDDPAVKRLRGLQAQMQSDWAAQSLGTLSRLVEPVKALFSRFSRNQLSLIAVLAEACRRLPL